MTTRNLSAIPEEYRIHLGFYSREAYDVLKFAMKTYNHPYTVADNGLFIAPNGEVVYAYVRPFTDEKEKLNIRRDLIPPLKQLLLAMGRANRLDCGYGYIDIRNNQTNPIYSNSYTKTYREFQLNENFDMTTTMTHVALMIELIGNYRDRSKVLSEWQKDIADAIIQAPRDPFTTAAIQALEGEINEMTFKKQAELSEIGKLYQECENKWKAKIAEVSARIAELQNAAANA